MNRKFGDLIYIKTDVLPDVSKCVIKPDPNSLNGMIYAYNQNIKLNVQQLIFKLEELLCEEKAELDKNIELKPEHEEHHTILDWQGNIIELPTTFERLISGGKNTIAKYLYNLVVLDMEQGVDASQKIEQIKEYCVDEDWGEVMLDHMEPLLKKVS